MGGMQTFQIALKHLDMFAYIGGFSGAGGGFGGPFDAKTANGGVMADADAFNKKVQLLWLGIGTAEPQRMYEGVKDYHEASKRPGSSTSITSRRAHRTSGSPGGAACTSLPRSCSRTRRRPHRPVRGRGSGTAVRVSSPSS